MVFLIRKTGLVKNSCLTVQVYTIINGPGQDIENSNKSDNTEEILEDRVNENKN